MKYFYYTEFLEGTQKKWFGNTKPTIDLISIGIVSEDNREYYAISKDFNLKEAWNRYDLEPDIDNGGIKKVYWIRENVLNPIFMELQQKEREYLDKQKRIIGYAPSINSEWSYSNFKTLINKYGKSNKQIADEIKLFTMQYSENKNEIWDKPTFYGYYSAYDHVALCWLFGKMIDLPKGFPMYTIDLKQMLDEKISQDNLEINGVKIPNYNLDKKIQTIKNITNYPKQTNEHNALSDAHFNYNLYKFLQTI
jgi:hypothetical protein